MLKALDIIIGLKIVCQPKLSQLEIANQLKLKQPQISHAIQSLLQSNLFWGNSRNLKPNYQGWEELLPSLKYFYPAKIGGITIGMPTSYGAPPLKQQIQQGDDPIPVWPCGYCKSKGIRIEPLHPNIPEALYAYPDQDFYELLTLVDALRIGRAREKTLGKKLLIEKLASLEKEQHEH